MKNVKLKTILLNIGGFALFVGAPLIPVGYFWDFFITKDAYTTLSTAALFTLISGTSVMKFIFKNDKLPFNVNHTWLVILVICIALTPIIQKLIYVSSFGVAGSIGGSFMFKQSNKISAADKKQTEENELINKVSEKLNESKR